MAAEAWQHKPAYLGGLPLQKTLPHSDESERAVLGAILLDSSLLKQVGQRLRSEDFYLERHQDLFRGMLLCQAAGIAPDPLTLRAKLGDVLFEQMGGFTYLGELDLSLPDLGRIDAYVEIVKERSTARGLVTQAGRLIRSVLEGDPLSTLIEGQAADLEAARRALGGSGVGGYRPLREALEGALERLEDGNPEERGKSGVTTGISRLDARLALEAGTVLLLGGRPGMGKTALLWQIAEHNALAGRGVAIQSLEMSGHALALRAICHHGEVAKTDLTRAAAGRGDLNPQQWSRVVQAARQLADLPVYVDTTRVLTGPDIGARLRRLKDDHPEIVLAEIDFLQLVSLEQIPGVYDPRMPKHEKIGALVRYFRNLAGELELVMLVLAQLTRDNEKANREPILPDLRDGGEEAADGVVFVHRSPREDDPAKLESRGKLILAKGREAETGSVPILFDGSGQRYTEPTSAEIEEERAAARARRKPKSYERED